MDAYRILAVFAFLVSLVSADPANYCGVNFTFAMTYGSNMVLQRGPTKARIWGYGFNVGDSVTVNIIGGSEYQTITTEGSAGRPVWTVDMDPVEEGGPYTITATSAECVITLENVLFGDVWICSGQSNMQHRLDNIDDPQSEIDDVVNYPNIRSFMTERITADFPQEDVGSGSRNWAVPTPEIMPSFSAVCWLFGKHLFNKYQHPIGLIQAAWGGTRIEAWSSPQALEVCFGDDVLPGIDENAASVLYNSMIHPFLPMPIYGGIWYQGESNVINAPYYGCALREMVGDWRSSWVNETDTMDPVFPFGEVQLAPFTELDRDCCMNNVRWQQTFEFGYVPNDQLQRFFMAVAIDLPDFDSPYDPIHPRYKRQIAERLALGAFDVAYGDTSSGPYSGPLPTGFSNDGTNIVLTHEGFTLEERGDPATYIGYEVCCSSDSTVFCLDTDTVWNLTEIVSVAGPDVTITMPCAEDQFVTGVRYSWRVSPCHILEECPIYADESANNLPAPPFVVHRLIL